MVTLYEGAIISRAEAKRLGLKRYFTGKPCKHGHIAQRTVDSCTCAECNRIISDKWNKDNIAIKRKLWSDWSKKNADFLREKRKKDRKENPEKYALRFKKWYLKNPEAVRVNAHKRRVLFINAEGEFTKEDIKLLVVSQRGKCANCQANLKNDYHIDHIMPLILGGSNWPENLQLLCKKCNLSKGGKHPIDWARENGRLL